MTGGRYTSRILGFVILAFGAVVLALGLFRGEQSFVDYFKLRRSERVLQEALAKLELENEKLAEEIERLKNSPSYAARVLRDKYHITEEGERIVFFTD